MEIVVGVLDLDELGHVNNATYFKFVESAARGHANAVGVTQLAMKQLCGAFVVWRHVATYYGESMQEDRLKLATWVHDFSASRCSRDVEIYRASHRIFHCQTEWVWIDVASRRPSRIPAVVKSAFGQKS